MEEKVRFYFNFIILIILEIVLINFAFPFFLSITFENCLTLLLGLADKDLVLVIVKHVALLWALMGLSLAIIILLISQFFNNKGFKKIVYFSRIIAIYSSLMIIFFFILIFFFSSVVQTESGCHYIIANFFVDGFIY